MNYPVVMDEWTTLTKVLEGRSLARFGDGEFKLLGGRDCISQIYDARLRGELNNTIYSPPANLVVGIPNMTKDSPKYGKWEGYINRYTTYLHPKVVYGSAFVTRPDSAPWIDTPEFYNAVESLWRGKEVVLVGNGKRSLKQEFLELAARKVHFVQCSYRDSYAQIDELEKQVLELPDCPVILCCGATATVLARRLAMHNRHAIDLGHIGMFWKGSYETTD